MIRLLGAELTRLFSRRFTVIAAILVVAAVAALQLVVNSEISPPSGAELAAAQSQYEESHRDWEANHTEYEQDCQANSDPGTDCTYSEPTLSDYQYSVGFVDAAETSLSIAIYLTALAVFMVAGSFIGAEFSSGSISNWLTFIPQRNRVFASKLIAVLVFSAVLSLVVSGLALLGPIVLANAYGVDTVGLGRLAGVGGRGILVAVALATVGFCIGLLSRHTAAAIGVLLGYLFLWFVRGIFLAENATAQRLTRWSPEGNLAAIVEKPHRYSVPVQQVTSDGVMFDYVERTISLSHGLVYWAVVLAVVITGTLLIFQRRDVT